MNSLLRALVTAPWRVMPRAARVAFVKSALYGAATQPSRDALRELLEVDAFLSGQIDVASLGYGDGVHVKHRLMRYHDFFVERIGPTDRVLDVGCGYGAVARSIAQRTGADVTGIDLDAANVAQARSAPLARLHFVHGRAPEDVPPQGFDVIVLSNVLEHIEHRVAFLRELQTRTGAPRLLIRVPMINRDWRVPLRAELGLFHFSDPTHSVEYTREGFESEMREAGLRVVHLQINWGEIWSEVCADA
jgi:SAM-dependent methyltransferase